MLERLLHGDAQMSNVLVDGDSSYAALIDWGCAGWGDVAGDFLAVPMAAADLMLAGHRELAPLDSDGTAEARILWRRMHMTFSVMPRGAAAETSWGERPIAWLTDLLRFFVEAPGRWREVGPG